MTEAWQAVSIIVHKKLYWHVKGDILKISQNGGSYEGK